MNAPSTAVKEKQKTNLKSKKPVKYQVVFHNDDVTPMDYVVAILVKVFAHTEESSTAIMLKVHNEGRAVAGIYMREIALTKQKEVEHYNKSFQQNLKITVEPVTE